MSLSSGIYREIRTKFHKKYQKNANSMKKLQENEKIRKFIIQSRKNDDDFWLTF